MLQVISLICSETPENQITGSVDVCETHWDLTVKKGFIYKQCVIEDECQTIVTLIFLFISSKFGN